MSRIILLICCSLVFCSTYADQPPACNTDGSCNNGGVCCVENPCGTKGFNYDCVKFYKSGDNTPACPQHGGCVTTTITWTNFWGQDVTDCSQCLSKQ